MPEKGGQEQVYEPHSSREGEEPDPERQWLPRKGNAILYLLPKEQEPHGTWKWLVVLCWSSKGLLLHFAPGRGPGGHARCHSGSLPEGCR